MSAPDRPLPALDTEFKPSGAAAAVLVGTLDTLSKLVLQIDAIGHRPGPVGCVVVGDGSRTGTIPGPNGQGVAILGGLEELPRLRDRLRIKGAVVSLPASMPTVTASVRRTLAELGIEERFVPPLQEALTVGVRAEGWWRPQGSELDPTALLGRDSHRLDQVSVGRALRGKRVLITGAGGSIGSQLARIAGSFEPESLILMERSENALFEIDRQLAGMGAARRAVLHDVVDAAGTRELLEQTRPHVVFHAAAHKHVPLMEDHPTHAITNNVFGTKSVADAAAACGAERFVLISTDKAVYPTSIMGATKRVAELYVRWLHRELRQTREGETSFALVRFGNVLGSACSVLPIWAAQLADGGPITVTDTRMTRFFMTIPEAATLVTQAAALSGVGQASSADASLFVLDMGRPVRILELAQRFLEQRGFRSVVCEGNQHSPPSTGEIEIVVTGIRPGEKLDEELNYEAEHLRPTRHPGIQAWDADSDPLPDVDAILQTLDGLRGESDAERVGEVLRASVPGVRPVSLRHAG